MTASEEPLRRRLDATRESLTHKFDVDGNEGYITVGLYKDGSVGEIFIKMAKQGSTLGGLMDSLAILVSMSLQYGVPLQVLVQKFVHTKFEPSGYTSNEKIPIASSIIDYIFRWLAIEFLSEEDWPISLRQQSIPKDLDSTQVALPANIHKSATYNDSQVCVQCGAISVRIGDTFICENCGSKVTINR